MSLTMFPLNHSFQITQQLEGICLQVIGTVLQQHVLGKRSPHPSAITLHVVH